MRPGAFIAYVFSLVFFGSLAFGLTLFVASLFGTFPVCVFDGEPTATTQAFFRSILLGFLAALLLLGLLGPRLARKSGRHVVGVIIAVYATVGTATLVAAGIIGDQPCERDSFPA